MLFVWWSGNGDMHLKKFSLLTGEDRVIRLTPAYDLVCTRLVIPDDPLEFPIVGKKDRADWLEFARYCNLPEKPATRALEELAATGDKAKRLIDRSFLPLDHKKEMTELVLDRIAALSSFE